MSVTAAFCLSAAGLAVLESESQSRIESESAPFCSSSSARTALVGGLADDVACSLVLRCDDDSALLPDRLAPDEELRSLGI